MKDFQRSRMLRIRPGAPLLAALALGFAGTLLGGPAAHASGTDTSVTHLPTAPVAQPMHLIWGSIRERGDAASADAAQAPGQESAPSQTPSQVAPAQAATSPYHVLWVRVRLYEDGQYVFLSDNADEDEMSDEGMEDGSIVAFVPLAVSD